jgi:cystathionine beta-lyase/cystathionine gamma-synthase
MSPADPRGDGTRAVHAGLSAERRARWGRDSAAPGFVRLSAGCEDTRDLVADIGAALDAVSPR